MLRYKLRQRERIERTTQAARAPRRVRRWGPWKMVNKSDSAKHLRDLIDRFAKLGGLREVAVFDGRNRLTPQQLEKRAAEEGDQAG